MNAIFVTLLVIHITAGLVGLITGFINLSRRKGDKKHRSVGKIFTYAMLVTGFSSVILAIIHPNSFLFIIGIFTIYLVGTGNRYIYLKLLDSKVRPKLLDWIFTISMLVTGLIFLTVGLKLLFAQKYFGIVYLVFSLFSLRLVLSDFSNYRGKNKEINFWLLAHIQRMTGAFISALTAFLVVNAKYFPIQLPSVVVWLLPTAVLVPLIIYWSKKYSFKRKQA